MGPKNPLAHDLRKADQFREVSLRFTGPNPHGRSTAAIAMPTPDVRRASTKSLLRELLARPKRAMRAQMSPAGPTGTKAGAGSFDQTPFDTLRRGGRQEVPLWSGYRNSIKGRWSRFFWPVRVLLDLDRKELLPERLHVMAQEQLRSRTLPVAIDELLEELAPVAKGLTNSVAQSEIVDPWTSVEMFAPVPSKPELNSAIRGHRTNAASMLATAQRHGFKPSGSRALEVGCGRGYTTYALAAHSIGEAVGIDLDHEYYYTIAEQPLMRDSMLAGVKDAVSRVRLEIGDAGALPYPDDSFDLVHSWSVLEHIVDLPAVFLEMHRVLKPGGLAYHLVDPWFGPEGGHSLCTMDFPWGHVRLSSEEFRGYLDAYRPHEAEQGWEFYQSGFQIPRHTACQMESLAITTGFQIVEWLDERSRHSDHSEFLNQSVLDECKQNFPEVTVRDLLTQNYTMVLRKPA